MAYPKINKLNERILLTIAVQLAIAVVLCAVLITYDAGILDGLFNNKIVKTALDISVAILVTVPIIIGTLYYFKNTPDLIDISWEVFVMFKVPGRKKYKPSLTADKIIFFVVTILVYTFVLNILSSVAPQIKVFHVFLPALVATIGLFRLLLQKLIFVHFINWVQEKFEATARTKNKNIRYESLETALQLSDINKHLPAEEKVLILYETMPSRNHLQNKDFAIMVAEYFKHHYYILLEGSPNNPAVHVAHYFQEYIGLEHHNKGFWVQQFITALKASDKVTVVGIKSHPKNTDLYSLPEKSYQREIRMARALNKKIIFLTITI